MVGRKGLMKVLCGYIVELLVGVWGGAIWAPLCPRNGVGDGGGGGIEALE